MLQYTWQRANLERNYNENAQNINYASILINPEIPGLAEPQSRDFGIGKMAGIPGFRDPGIPALIPIVYSLQRIATIYSTNAESEKRINKS